MNDLLQDFKTLLDEAPGRLLRFSDAEAEARPAPDKWSKKEILGHLIDSVSNNHQRIVRMQLQPQLSFPGYRQELWVGTQRYQQEPWRVMIQAWEGFNRHLLHVIAQIPEEKLANRCSLDGGEPMTLEFLVRDYVRHLRHHLGQIMG
ncbi:MAG: DinB family protein [Terriglobia bacterium]